MGIDQVEGQEGHAILSRCCQGGHLLESQGRRGTLQVRVIVPVKSPQWRDVNQSKCQQQSAAQAGWDMTTHEATTQDTSPNTQERGWWLSTSIREELLQAKAKGPASSPTSAALTPITDQPCPEETQSSMQLGRHHYLSYTQACQRAAVSSPVPHTCWTWRSQISIPLTPGRSQGVLQHKSLKQDLSMAVGMLETICKLISPPPLHIPLLDQPDDTADCTLDDMLKQLLQTTTTVGDAVPAFLIDPQSLPYDTEVHLPPVSEGSQTTLQFDPDDIILVGL